MERKMIEVNGKYTNAKIMIDEVDNETMSQIYAMANHPSFINPIAIMPDTHAGKGSVIGFTMPIGNNVIPNIIGVDISCGMRSVKLGKNLFSAITKPELDKLIRDIIPFGINVRPKVSKFAKFEWKKVNQNIHNFTLRFNEKLKKDQLYSLCREVGITDKKVLEKIYENTYNNGTHKLDDDVMKLLSSI